MIPIEAKLIASGAGLVLLFVLFGVYRHSLIAQGEAKILAVNTRQAAALQKQANEITADWQEKAAQATHNHDQELDDLRAYRESHPITGASELCKQSPGRPSNLPATVNTDTGHAAGSNPSPVGKPVHSGDPDVAANRTQMLDVVGSIFDIQSAALREWQQRERDEGPVTPK